MRIHKKFVGLDWLELFFFIIETIFAAWLAVNVTFITAFVYGLGTCSLDVNCSNLGLNKMNHSLISIILIYLAFVFGQHFLISYLKKRKQGEVN